MRSTFVRKEGEPRRTVQRLDSRADKNLAERVRPDQEGLNDPCLLSANSCSAHTHHHLG